LGHNQIFFLSHGNLSGTGSKRLFEVKANKIHEAGDLVLLLKSFLHLLLADLSGLSTSILGTVTVKLHKLRDIELGGLEDLALSDEAVLDRVDGGAGALNILAHGLRNELADDLLEVAGRGLTVHHLEHLCSDAADFRALSIAGLLELVGLLLGEGDAEKAEGVAVSGLHINVGLDEGLPLADKAAKSVGGEAHAPEVGKAVLALHILASKTDLPVGLILVLVKVSQVHLEDAALQTLGSDLGSLGLSNEGLSAVPLREHGGGLNVIILLLGEGINKLLLVALPTLSETLVLLTAPRV